MSDTSTTVLVMDWYESARGDWGRSGRTWCEKCRGYGQSDF